MSSVHLSVLTSLLPYRDVFENVKYMPERLQCIRMNSMCGPDTEISRTEVKCRFFGPEGRQPTGHVNESVVCRLDPV